MSTVHINIGSNLGDSRSMLERAVAEISSRWPDGRVRRSSIVESEPWGFKSPHRFLNIGVELHTDESPEAVLDALQEIERRLCDAPHRAEDGTYIDRAVDIDLIYYDNLVIDTPRLTLPHPRMHLRPFVMGPLRELAPNWRHPLGLCDDEPPTRKPQKKIKPVTAAAALAEQRRLLTLEYEEEKAAFSVQTARTGVDRLVSRGNAWYPVKASRSYYNSLNQHIIEITREPAPDADDADDHSFEYGKQVMLFRVDGSGTIHNIFPGTVSFVDGSRMAVVVADSADMGRLDEVRCGVMLAFDETSYRVMFEALARVASARGRLAELRDIIYSNRAVERTQLPEVAFPYLNESQQRAVNMVLGSRDVAVVHGPPGTGKTTTLVEAIQETLRRETQVLVCAQSNMAVDWICEKLVDRGINVLRIGNPSRVTDKMLSFTYERRFESHPDYPLLWSIRKNIREMRASRGKSSESRRDRLDSLRNRATELEIRINRDIFDSVSVVASTLVGSANRLLERMHFSTVFIDEAAQALEAACWIPMRCASRIVLAGDHCQLPATVKCYEAMKQGLGRSLMERIVELHPEAVSLLTVQYRMNDALMQFSNEWFYEGAMTSAPEVAWRGLLDYDTPMQWIDTSHFSMQADGCEEEQAIRESASDDGCGRYNHDEALLTLAALQQYIEKIGAERFIEERIDVGLISPYRAQVRHLRGLLRKIPFFRPFRKLITVNTVDGFQGQERDVIVISMVRSNDDGQIGFLRDLRRMNVAITRARMKLIIIGDAPTLSAHPFYRRLLAYVRSCRRHDDDGAEG